MTIYHLERASDNSFRKFERPPPGLGTPTTEPRTCLISACIIRLQTDRRQCQVVRSTGCAARNNRAIGPLSRRRVAQARRLGNNGSAKPKTDRPVVRCDPTLPWLLSRYFCLTNSHYCYSNEPGLRAVSLRKSYVWPASRVRESVRVPGKLPCFRLLGMPPVHCRRV